MYLTLRQRKLGYGIKQFSLQLTGIYCVSRHIAIFCDQMVSQSLSLAIPFKILNLNLVCEKEQQSVYAQDMLDTSLCSLSGQNKWTVFSGGGEFPSIRFLRPYL